MVHSSPSYAAMHLDIEKWPSTAVEMPGTCLQMDIRLLGRTPVVSPPVLVEEYSSTTKQSLERKAVSIDEEDSACEHSPVTKAAPTPPSQSLASSVPAISPHPRQDEIQLPLTEMPKQVKAI
jgi:hypothetical protein